jgi:hypothetical protein
MGVRFSAGIKPTVLLNEFLYREALFEPLRKTQYARIFADILPTDFLTGGRSYYRGVVTGLWYIDVRISYCGFN